MSSASSFDLESFQKLLADAFAVQESGLDTLSLLALGELHRLIAAGKPDVDRVLRLIADRARNVANATGVALGLLEAHRLVHRAGSGSAAALVGRQVTAVLSASNPKESRSEILRVENAQVDTRIEAAVCRQLEAQSLLILPIYHEGAVAGVIEVLFDEPHVFQDREVRVYRLMTGMVEDVMVKIGLEQRRSLALHSATVSPTVIPPAIVSPAKVFPAIAQSKLPAEQFGAGDRSGLRLVPESKIDPVPRTTSVPAELAGHWRPAQTTAIEHRLSHIPLRGFRWNVAATAAAMVIVLSALWVMYGHRPASAVRNSTPQEAGEIRQLVAPAKQEERVSNLPTAPHRAEGTKAAGSAFKRVRVGPNEVDYVANDVTIRRFTQKRAPARVQGGYSQVNVGKDVTVRYFASKRAMATRTEPTSSAAPSQVNLPVSK